jgi:glycosyltransferase involved in cell wall biosynthesis
VTAWGSPWPELARTFDADPTLSPIPLQADGSVDISAWVSASGIPPEQFIDLGVIPNRELARVYREADVALFPSRAEGGTNVVAMECMACGVPVILSSSTGHLDLIAPDRCFALRDQSPIDGADFAGWGESRVDEIAEAFETVWSDREAAAILGERGSHFMRTRTWAETTRLRANAIKPFC